VLKLALLVFPFAGFSSHVHFTFHKVVGIHQRPGDLAVNVCKTKQLTNMRSATKGITVGIVSVTYPKFCHCYSCSKNPYCATLQTAPIDMSLDACVEYIAVSDLELHQVMNYFCISPCLTFFCLSINVD
jgi:hypothetical protein